MAPVDEDAKLEAVAKFPPGELGMRLRTLREWCGIAQRKLAQAADLSTSTLRRYEQGRAVPPPEAVLRITEALHASLDHLVGSRYPPTAEEVAEMRVWWAVGQVDQAQATMTLTLLEGILSEVNRRRRRAAG